MNKERLYLSTIAPDAVYLADRCDLPFDWNPKKLHLFGMILFRQAPESLTDI